MDAGAARAVACRERTMQAVWIIRPARGRPHRPGAEGQSPHLVVVTRTQKRRAGQVPGALHRLPLDQDACRGSARPDARHTSGVRPGMPLRRLPLGAPRSQPPLASSVHRHSLTLSRHHRRAPPDATSQGPQGVRRTRLHRRPAMPHPHTRTVGRVTQRRLPVSDTPPHPHP